MFICFYCTNTNLLNLVLSVLSSGISHLQCSEGQMRTYRVTRGPRLTLTQQWRYLNLARNSFCILFSAKGFVSYMQIVSNRLYVPSKGTCSLAGRVLWNTSESLNSANVNYLKIPKKHHGPHKMLSRATCCPRVWDPRLSYYGRRKIPLRNI